MNPNPQLDLSNKIIYIYKTNRDTDVTIQNPVFETHHGRLFLVGRIPDGGSANDWLADLTTYVAWDQVEEFVVFDSIEDYHMRLSQAWNGKSLQ